MPVEWRRQREVLFKPAQFRFAFLNAAELARLNSFKALKKQVEWMAGRLAIKTLVAPNDLQAAQVAYRKLGAPYLPHIPHQPISISHSQDYAVAGIGPLDGGPIGLDIEKIDPASLAAMQRVAFSDREATLSRQGRTVDSFVIWTAKEAYLKQIQQGFHAGLKKIEILDGQIYHAQRRVTDITLTTRRIFQDYILSVVCADAACRAAVSNLNGFVG